MQYHQIEVDDEVFEFVKEHAEPLVDNFNSTVKRLLGLPHKRISQVKKPLHRLVSTIPGLSLPREVPQALRQILEVAYLVSRQGESRTDATRVVAQSHRVTPQTVLDKYCRQLGLTAPEFDRLLDDANLIELRKRLQKRFYQHSNLIDDVLTERDAA